MQYFKFLNQNHEEFYYEAFQEYINRNRYLRKDEASILYLVTLISSEMGIQTKELFDFDKGTIIMSVIKKHTLPRDMIQIMMLIYNFLTGRTCYEEFELYPIFDFFATTGFYKEYVLEAIGIWFNILDDNELKTA